MTAFYDKDDDSSLKVLFKLFDKDGSGEVDADELKAVFMATTAGTITDDQIEKMIDEADENGDGMI